jgi:hypothetical protein
MLCLHLLKLKNRLSLAVSKTFQNLACNSQRSNLRPASTLAVLPCISQETPVYTSWKPAPLKAATTDRSVVKYEAQKCLVESKDAVEVLLRVCMHVRHSMVTRTSLICAMEQ